MAILVFVASGSGQAQTTTQEDCAANECLSPVFDVGIVQRSPVGRYGITELMYAVETNNLARVESLLASGADVDARNDTGATALLMAAAYGNRSIIDRLLAAGADPNIGSHRGDTPLASAIQYGHTGIALALIEHGANPEISTRTDSPRPRRDALVKAAVLGQTDVVRALLDLGVNTRESGLEALNMALWKHHEDIAGLLLEADIDVNAPTYDATMYTHMQTGEFALQTAAQEGLRISTAMLIEKGADVNRRNAHGQSALHLAVRNNHPEVARILLDAGAVVVSDDLSSALDADNADVAEQLVLHLELSALEIAEIDALIVKADSINNPTLLDKLFAARDSIIATEPVKTLLFAKADADDCELVSWHLPDNRQRIVFSSPGLCEQGFFFNRQRAELYVLDGHEVRVVSLDVPSSPVQMIELPTAMIDGNLAELKQRVNLSYQGKVDAGWMTARVVQVGVLASGELAFVTHADGPADEIYGHLYAMAENGWQLRRNGDCHRFDPCRFSEVLSHSLHERPGKLAIWSPEIRRNPYFVDKVETKEVHYEDVSWNGVVTFNIDGQRQLLHYGKGEGGHCMGDCTYTTDLALELPDQRGVPITRSYGNNSIVDRYALVWKRPRPRSELIDLSNGTSVFGELQVAGWLH